MKKKNILFAFLSFAFIASQVGATASDLGLKTVRALDIKKARDSAQIVLKVYNADDYILPDMDAREAESNGYDPEPIKGINTRFEEYMLEQGVNVRIQYETYSTNEDMINQLKTGKIDYDIVCSSDYVVQRLMAQDLIIPFECDDYPGSTPTYDKYISPFLLDKIKSISAIDCYYSGKDSQEQTNVVQKYMRGYMWGTVGLLYNPEFYKFKDRGITQEKITKDINDWNILWNEDYKNTAYAKDSIRDTMAAVYMNAFHDEVYDLKSQYEAGTLNQTDYNLKLTEIFNRTKQNYLDQQVSQSLSALSKNIYGYEVDNGKDDIQKGTMVGIDLAWSGDAVYAMNGADELRENDPSKPLLYFTLPEGCDNIWIDGWMMTRNALSHGNTGIAQQYIDFLSTPSPENEDYTEGPTVSNIDYIGYTTVIASDEILDYLRNQFDIRSSDEEATYEDAPAGSEGGDYLKKDLTYFFNGNLEENSNAYIYYEVDQKDRQLDAMYPDESVLPRLVIMKDYGDRNSAMNEVWEAGKALQFPIWGYWVVLGVILAGVIIYVIYALRKKALKEKRQERMARIVLAMDQSQTTEKQRKDAKKIVDKRNKKTNTTNQ